MTISTFQPVQSLVRVSLSALVLAASSYGQFALAGPTLVPFKASVDTEEVIGFDLARCPATGFAGVTTGSGTASHLGAVTMSASDCLFLPYGVPSFNNGLLTLKAANGDELKATYQGNLIPINGSTTEFAIAGSFAISGGTGRFVQATGAGALLGTITLGPQVSKGRYRIEGTISY